MAVDQDLLDRIAATIADLYREVETALVRTVAQRLRRDLPLPSPFQEEKLDAIRQLQASARVLLASLQATRARVIRQAIADAYRSGGEAAVADLPRDWFPKSGIGQAARRATDVVPNARLMENLAAALHRDVGRTDQNILRAPVDAYRAVQAGAAARIASGAYTRREASQAAWSRLIEQGITSFTDRANRRWKLSSYVEMMARSNIQRAAVQGQTDRLAQLDIDLVYISDNVQECKLCRPFESKILRRDAGPVGDIRVEHATRDGVMVTVHVLDTLPGAMARGLFHPNCRHSASAYLPGITKLKTGTADPEGDAARQRQRALERRIRAAKEQEAGALTPEAKKDARADVRAAQAALRAHLAAHPTLKRLPYREQIGAGNIPRGEAPGGPVGDLQPPIQDQLPLGAPERAAEPPRVEAVVPDPAPEPVQVQAVISEPEPAPAAEPVREPTLADHVASGIARQEEISQGGVARVERVHFNDGGVAIRKIVDDSFAYTATHQADAEELGAAVARALGVPAPDVHRAGEHELFIELMPGKPAGLTKRPTRYWLTPDGRRIAVLDQLVDYADRHDLNWLVDKGRLVAIDFGLAFGFIKAGTYDTLRDPATPRFRYLGQFEKLFVNRPPVESAKVPATWRDNDLSPDDITALRQVLAGLRPRFEALGRADWHDRMLAVLDALAQHAKGTERWLPDLPGGA